MDIQFPPFLQKGDKVVIVSPSSKIDKQFLKGAKKRIESWGVLLWESTPEVHPGDMPARSANV
jgi:muramoyltetrapeptide carboxypeptidase LdcA involved in peptidoglycan recycling